MARYRNSNTGALVSVRDDKVLGAEWERPDAEPARGYSDQKVADLQAEIARRNADRDEVGQLSTEGKKADLIATLEADDTAKSGE